MGEPDVSEARGGAGKARAESASDKEYDQGGDGEASAGGCEMCVFYSPEHFAPRFGLQIWAARHAQGAQSLSSFPNMPRMNRIVTSEESMLTRDLCRDSERAG